MLVFTNTIVHELSHLGIAKLLKHPCKAHVFVFKAYVEFRNDLPKRDFIIIAIAPFVVHIAQFIIFVSIFPYNLLVSSCFALMSVLYCMSDGYFI